MTDIISHITLMDENAKSKKRERLSVALSKYPDVKRMQARYSRDYPGTSVTYQTITALREFYTKLGYARKKDLAQ